jgi:plastocyanin
MTVVIGFRAVTTVVITIMVTAAMLAPALGSSQLPRAGGASVGDAGAGTGAGDAGAGAGVENASAGGIHSARAARVQAGASSTRKHRRRRRHKHKKPVTKPPIVPADSVVIQGYAFHPGVLTIKPGATVTWLFRDSGIAHWLLSDTEGIVFQSVLRRRGRSPSATRRWGPTPTRAPCTRG